MRDHRLAGAGLLLLGSIPVLWRVLQVTTRNVSVFSPWVKTSVHIITALPMTAAFLAVLGLRFDRSKWLTPVTLALSLLTEWVMLILGLLS